MEKEMPRKGKTLDMEYGRTRTAALSRIRKKKPDRDRRLLLLKKELERFYLLGLDFSK
jgi:hypothetical protein